MDIYAQLVDRIIKGQEEIIGPIAWEQALKVPGLAKDPITRKPILRGDPKKILKNLVKQYEFLFGQISIEVCKEAIKPLIYDARKAQLPTILQ
jgi:hypothetical protein